MNRRRRFIGKRAFATVTAVTLIALAGVAIASMAAAFAAESRRTQSDLSDAQLRQFLIAGQLVARDHLNAPAAAEPVALAMPNDAGDGAALTMRTVSAAFVSQRRIELTCTIGRRKASQTLTYQRMNDRWQMVSAGSWRVIFG